MKVVAFMTILVVSLSITACGNSGSSGSVSKSEALSLCRSSVERAVQGAGSDERDMVRAGERALESCMAGYGYYPN